jgi:hypothetical protein
MASPHVAGGAALHLPQPSPSTPTDAEKALRQTAQLTGTQSKDGRPDARESVTAS